LDPLYAQTATCDWGFKSADLDLLDALPLIGNLSCCSPAE
jgi:hypothetical protein